MMLNIDKLKADFLSFLKEIIQAEAPPEYTNTVRVSIWDKNPLLMLIKRLLRIIGARLYMLGLDVPKKKAMRVIFNSVEIINDDLIIEHLNHAKIYKDMEYVGPFGTTTKPILDENIYHDYKKHYLSRLDSIRDPRGTLALFQDYYDIDKKVPEDDERKAIILDNNILGVFDTRDRNKTFYDIIREIKELYGIKLLVFYNGGIFDPDPVKCDSIYLGYANENELNIDQPVERDIDF